MVDLQREELLPERRLPDVDQLIQHGRELARDHDIGSSVFLQHYGFTSECDYKKHRVDQGEIMLHAQIGYREIDQSVRAWGDIYDNLDKHGYRVDRYGICLDWSMGYPKDQRVGKPRGTGLILNDDDDCTRLANTAPVAAHFGDFVLGMPAAIENTQAALAAGSTSIGNLGQYFTFRLPHWDDDIATTAATVTAISLASSQPVDVLIHSNLDDGFAALFSDMICALGAVLLEKYIVDELLGGKVSHCYGHTYSQPLNRLAFQRALHQVSNVPGTMVYGNTTIYGDQFVENFANLGSYLSVDILAQQTLPTGHAINPVPVSEALRIPTVDEIIEAHLFANRLIDRTKEFGDLIDFTKADRVAGQLVSGAKTFKDNVLNGLEVAGVDINNAFELLLSLRRVGAKQLEILFGPGEADEKSPNGRIPVVPANAMSEIFQQASVIIDRLDECKHRCIRRAGVKVCIATTDVHEYGKWLVDQTLSQLNVTLIDAGTSTDPEVLVSVAQQGEADFIALSTYNGVALDYLHNLREAMHKTKFNVPVYVGGKLNQIMDGDNNNMPVDVESELSANGALVCHRIDDMLNHMADYLAGDNR